MLPANWHTTPSFIRLRSAKQPSTKRIVKTHALLSAASGPLFAVLTLFAGSTPGQAAPLMATAAVQTQPDPSAPIITYLKAGSDPAPAAGDSVVAPPPGWMAVAVPGPFQGYVLNKDFTKGLTVKPGSSVYLAPKPDAGVLAVTAAGDKTEITGLYVKWTQISLARDLVGYIQTAAPAQASQPTAAPAPIPVLSAGPGTAVSGGADAVLPRSFEGRFSATHHLFAKHQHYDWQLTDESGSRVAYVDVSKLLFTEQVDTYADRALVVYGSVSAVPGGKDIVIAAESLQLK